MSDVCALRSTGSRRRGARFRPLWLGALVACLALAVAPPAEAQPRGARAAKAAPKKPAKKAPKPSAVSNKAPRKAGSVAAPPDPGARASIAGGSPATTVAESPELAAIREVDDALFPELVDEDEMPLAGARAPRLVAKNGLPPAREEATPQTPPDVKWMARLDKPDIPFRWDARLVRYLDYFKNNPRGRAFVAGMMKRAGRYEGSIRTALRARNMPEDIVWLSLVESGMNPRIASPVGAAGLWQFMPQAGEAYGLRIDRWIDERLDPERSTDAALRYLSDLHARFGRWELAFAAYNMGHGGLLSAIRKYNTNDFWELSHVEAGVPYETALYVPKIVAIAFVARNREVFGCHEVVADPAESLAPAPSPQAKTAPSAAKKPSSELAAVLPQGTEVVQIGPGQGLEPVAKAARLSVDELRALNPQLLGASTPPAAKGAPATYGVRVPAGTGDAVRASLSPPASASGLERHVVRWGESLERIAEARGTTEAKLRSTNGLTGSVPPRPGTVLLVPRAASAAAREPLVAVVPSRTRSYEGRRRVLYEVVWGDRIEDVARVLGVSVDELCHWNNVDRTAKLHAKMVLQAFVRQEHRLDAVVATEERDARVLVAGSPEFFDHFETKNGRVRVVVAAGEGDTFSKLATRYGISVGMLERINHRSRSTKLTPGEKVVVYARRDKAPATPDTDEPDAGRADLGDLATTREGG